MKSISILFLSLFSLNAFPQGYRCEGYCAGVDYNRGYFFDAGYQFSEYPGHPELGYRALIRKCQNRLPKNVLARIYRNVEIKRESRTTVTSSSTYETGYDVYRGYYWFPYSSGSNTYTQTYEDRFSIKIDSLLSTESCHFDESIKVPTYDGDEPVQG